MSTEVDDTERLLSGDPPLPRESWRRMRGSPLSSLSVSSTSVETLGLLSYFSAAQMELPIRLSLRVYLPGSHLVETLLSTSLHVSVDIHGLWRAARLSGFGTVRRNSAKILSIRVLV